MINFNEYMSDYQTKWREGSIQSKEMGTQNGKEYHWILPRHLWEEGLYPSIRSGQSNSLPEYIERTGVQKHDGVHNLKSSWMQCVNLYFPFIEDPGLLADFLCKYISPQIKTVDRIELEWAEDEPFDPTTLLGEPQGQRGKNQTSPDIAFLVNGGKGIVLTENKLVEHSFYPCSGRNKEYGNPDRNRCMNFKQIYSDAEKHCHMLQWAHGHRTNRKYWDYIEFSPEALKTLKRCPAATSGYQLFRQQALAEALAQSGKYELVFSCVAYDARNQTLINCLRGTGIENFATGWGNLFKGKAKFTTFTHQDWVNWVREHDKTRKWKDWLKYVEDRYGYK